MSKQWYTDRLDQIDAAVRTEATTPWDAHRMRLAAICDLYVEEGGTREGYLRILTETGVPN